ncbi:Thiol-disulfide isomerase or thioredoxin [Loktanella sp. DSM 29012]|uniref:TlpA family protein disulfide reductase n=1 Tax=Loktanella sp. DSM 29012 TaxID=1881056 RepID=UPI0008C94578|nr:TlpA disulfide reductase family protein [Loktanella sp. DSM 29012]SEQ44732.1 Thiol-disulfide isomerase or thioredoxin [Loktanella sp. DSM 29012]
MALKTSTLIYTGAACLAIAVLTVGSGVLTPAPTPSPVNTIALQDLADGDMRKLTWSGPVPLPDVTFVSEDGTQASLTDYAGKPVVLNFWATWCAPCRVEMPHLSALQTALGEEAAVLTVATGRNDPAGIDRFFTEIGVTNLPKATDANQSMARAFGVLGLPATIIVDAQGQEIARLLGEADWSSDSAQNIIRALADD